MSKKAELEIILNTFKADGSLLPDGITGNDGKISIAAYDSLVHGDLQIVDTDGVLTVDFESITSVKGFILKNKGGGAITYKFSSAPGDSGILQENSIIIIFNASIDVITIKTGNVTGVDYEYWVFG